MYLGTYHASRANKGNNADRLPQSKSIEAFTAIAASEAANDVHEHHS